MATKFIEIDSALVKKFKALPEVASFIEAGNKDKYIDCYIIIHDGKSSAIYCTKRNKYKCSEAVHIFIHKMLGLESFCLYDIPKLAIQPTGRSFAPSDCFWDNSYKNSFNEVHEDLLCWLKGDLRWTHTRNNT